MANLNLETFNNVDLRVATVVSAERVPKTDRLLKVVVRMGADERTLVAGIGDSHAPDALVGRQVVVVANLEPATIRGVESKGMLLAAVDGGRTVLVGPEQPVADGSKIG